MYKPLALKNPAYKQATFGAGCFWCVEAIYQRLDGVEHVESGYSGGHVENPTYEEVCGKKTGHAEVIRIAYDPEKIGYEELLDVFWKTHDPTTPNQQGNDKGPQYRSVIYFHDEEQERIARASLAAAEEAKLYDKPIVTEIGPLINYYRAEGYHQNYFNENPMQGYCYYLISPKVAKFEQLFKEKLRK
jgi:peptide-methionine (S)-S-oxide reductase